MKKKLAALLCGVMCVGAFSGCSTDELGYLKMAANAMDTMKTCEVKGTMQADINFDALETFMTDVAKQQVRIWLRQLGNSLTAERPCRWITI